MIGVVVVSGHVEAEKLDSELTIDRPARRRQSVDRLNDGLVSLGVQIKRMRTYARRTCTLRLFDIAFPTFLASDGITP